MSQLANQKQIQPYFKSTTGAKEHFNHNLEAENTAIFLNWIRLLQIQG